MERVKYVKEYLYTFSNHINKTRKRPVPGLKRHFNTPTGKKIISEEQKIKISQGLLRYNKHKQLVKYKINNGD